MKSYAQINEENIAIATAVVPDNTIVPDGWIRIENSNVLGKKWTGNGWEDVPQPEPIEPQPEPIEPQPTNTDIMNEIKKSQQDVIDEYTLQLVNEGIL